MKLLAELRASLRLLLLATLATGVVYPLGVAGVARLFWPERARGSLVVRDGVVRGARLVAQDFRSERWFHGRPSATAPGPCSPWPSTGSNLGPTSPELGADFGRRAAALRAQGLTAPFPAELLCASASGIDPHISPRAAYAQVERVARARGLDPARVRVSVEEFVERPLAGFLGEARVNVLQLNLAIEDLR